jgi:archaellum component FlaF (FlaF/FlaG flagellin family)
VVVVTPDEQNGSLINSVNSQDSIAGIFNLPATNSVTYLLPGQHASFSVDSALGIEAAFENQTSEAGTVTVSVDGAPAYTISVPGNPVPWTLQSIAPFGQQNYQSVRFDCVSGLIKLAGVVFYR